MHNKRLPAITINLDAIAQNASVLCDTCEKNGISVAGVIKFSDGDVNIAKAYAKGGCRQIGVSRAVHLKALKESLPHAETLLTRSPARCDIADTARYADLSLHSDKDILFALNEEAKAVNTRPGVILMLDVGDLREGAENISEITELAKLVEFKLTNLELKGVGTGYACMSGVLPDYENLSFLVEGAKAIEKVIGRKLEYISGGSSVNLLLLKDGINKMPPEINHLRIGGIIANPMNIRLARNLSFNGMREDSAVLRAELVEVREKNSVPKNSSNQNGAGEPVSFTDKGRRIRGILALGTQDIYDFSMLIPIDDGIEVIGSSSDHTVVDVTDSRKKWKSGDSLTFKMRYSALMCAFSGKHVAIEYVYD